MPKLKWIEIAGFRAFGENPQRMEFCSPIAVGWGPNSQGKTSIAEAVEFLLTGSICRCELTASSQDEFADALRNAHLPPTAHVYVAACVQDSGPATHIIRRTLTQDYGKKSRCLSSLVINGKPAGESDLQGLGFRMSAPPLSSPVLLQHTLSYLFSANPKERSMYFKNLLEVADLEELREAVADAGKQFAAVFPPALAKLQTCAVSLRSGDNLQSLLKLIPDSATIAQAFSETAAALLKGASLPVPAKDAERYASVREALDAARSKKFPMGGLAHIALSGWSAPDASAWEGIENFLTKTKEVGEETKRLTKLFSEVLALKDVAGADKPVDCPVCASPEALTPQRVLAIRERLKEDTSYNEARLCAEAAARDLQSAANSLERVAGKALPESIRLKGKWRRKNGFRVAKIRDLLGTNTPDLADEWLQGLRELSRAAHLTSRRAGAVLAGVGRFAANLAQQTSASELKCLFAECNEAYQLLQTASSGYAKINLQLRGQLQAIIDKTIAVTGWDDFLELSSRQSELLDALIQKSATDMVLDQHSRALKEIDRAIEKVLETKFSTLSAEVANWWERLRPGERTFFESVKQRPKARRTVDFKAGLCVGDDRGTASLRDAVAVFSQSQLHCLGLASFLARAIREPNGFMVFDDPIISSDEDYRAHFVCTVLEELMKLGQQVLLLTQDC